MQPRATPVEALAVALLAGAVGLALLPGLIIGAAIAGILRRASARWTWLVVPGMVGLTVLIVSLPAAVAQAPRITVAVIGVWGGVGPLTAIGVLIWRERRDRLHGGHAERALAGYRGPLEAFGDKRRASKEIAAGISTADGFLLGADDRGRPLRIPSLRAHCTIVGGSDSGKTNTAIVMLEAHVAGGGGFVILDGKGGRELPHAAVRLGAEHRRPVLLWSMHPYGHPGLDRFRVSWNPVGDGDPTEVKDRIASSEPQTEPYYKAVASRGLLLAAQSLALSGHVARLDRLADLLESPSTLTAGLRSAPERFTADIKWLGSLNDTERGALRGMAIRLRIMVSCDGAAALLPADNELDLYTAIRHGWLVVLTLPQGLYPELVPQVTRYALQAINSVCTRLEGEGRRANAIAFIDELSAFDGDQLCAGYERGRSAGVRFVVATQSLSNFDSAGGPKLLHAALDNAELLIVHRQAVPDAAETLASIGGTEEAWEHTHKVSEGASMRLGLDETGDRARRLTDRFRAHPNEIKQLGLGEAIVISHRPRFRVFRARVRPARTPPASKTSEHQPGLEANGGKVEV